LDNSQSRRNFSNTPAARITLEDDDEDDGVTPLVINRRPRRPEDIRGSKGDLRQILASRKKREKPKQRSVLTPLDRIEIRKIEQKALSIIPASQLVQEFLDIRYPFIVNAVLRCDQFYRQLKGQYRKTIHATIAWLEAEVRQGQDENRLIEHEYCEIYFVASAWLEAEVRQGHYENWLIEHEFCEIYFAESPRLEERVDESVKRFSELQYAVLEGIIGTLEVFTRDLAGLVEEEYLRPRKSARARIDALLAYSESFQPDYSKLQDKAFAVAGGGNDILQILSSLSGLVVPGGPDFRALWRATRLHNLAVSRASHVHRRYFLDSRELQHPLKAATAHIHSNAMEISFTVAAWKIVEAVLFNRPLKRVIEMKHRAVARAIQVQYMEWLRSKALKYSPETRYLRQLDVMAPFEILVIMQRQLVNEAWHLIGSLQGAFGPLWDGLPKHKAVSVNQSIYGWVTEYRAQQKDFLIHLRMYRYINWIRLQVEEKLQELDLPDTVQGQGFFIVPKPLSQDRARFQCYVQSIASLGFDTWFLGRILGIMYASEGSLGRASNMKWEKMMDILYKREQLIKSPAIPDLGSQSAAAAAAWKKIRRRRARSSSKIVARPHDKTTAQQPQFQPSKVAETDQYEMLDSHKAFETHMRLSSQSDQTNEQVPFTTAMSRLMRPFWRPQRTNSKQRVLTKTSFDAALPNSAKQTPASRPPASDKKSSNFVKRPWSVNLVSSKSDSPVPRGRRAAVEKEKPPATRKSPQTATETSPWESEKESVLTELQATVKQLQAQIKELEEKKESRPLPASVARRTTVGRRTIRSYIRRRTLRTRRSYCTDSRFTHLSARQCSHDSKESAIPASFITAIADEPVVPTQDEILPDQASSSELNAKANKEPGPLFWSHSDQRAPNGQKLIVHYCRSLESTEDVAKHFLNSKVIGFDMEWKAQVFASDSIQNNLSLIQIANEERIALFQIALFKPARTLEDFVAPSLRRILESPDITKVGVAIKADSTRLRKYLGVEAQSIFELSHLFKLVKHGQANPKLVNKRSVNLSEQIQEHFGRPLEKSEDVRCGDWTRSLNYRQVQCEYIPVFHC